MRMALCFIIGLLAGSIVGFPNYRKLTEDLSMKDILDEDEIFFKDCREHTCHDGIYRGYTCHAGYCRKVCNHDRCWENDYDFESVDERLDEEIFFEGCEEENCNRDMYRGYNCYHGTCEKICDFNKCWESKRRTISSNEMNKMNMIFEGCYENTCRHEKYSGYDCFDEHCEKICDQLVCWETDYKEKMGTAENAIGVIFDGCSKKNCQKNQFFGYDCNDGYCSKICDSNKCWNSHYKHDISHVKNKDEILFHNCHENMCQDDEYNGYNCDDGYCANVCDQHNCWKQESHQVLKVPEIVKNFIFKGCIKDTCIKDNHYGYGCHNGYCNKICNENMCWDTEKELIQGKAKFGTEIVFEDCYEKNCQNNGFYGYGCHNGYCDKVCNHRECWKSEYEVVASNLKRRKDIIFYGCVKYNCQMDKYYGLECRDGYCSKVCDDLECWQPKYKTEIKTAIVEVDVIFKGCHEDKCANNQFHGYDCLEGYCNSVCDDQKCWKPNYNRFSGEAKIVADVIFEDCSENDCYKDKFYGYNCHDGYCTKVCDERKCWEQGKRVIKAINTIKEDAVFEGCYEETCRIDQYYGYDCQDQYCEKVCDEHNCWEPEYKKSFGYAQIKANVIFEGCYEHKCTKDNYHGYNCVEGYCSSVCDQKGCWEPKYNKILVKAKLSTDIVFEGCVEESCHRDKFYGYDCQDGYCRKICDEHECWEPKYKALSGKASIETEIIFEGCFEEDCRHEDYFGYDCHSGYCAKVCDRHECWHPEHKKTSIKPKITSDIFFDGCVEDACHKDQYYGYNCQFGYCGKVCDEKNCWKQEHEGNIELEKIRAHVIFSGCREENCQNDEYFGYDCNDGHCVKVCDLHECWQPKLAIFSAKNNVGSDIIFKGCIKENCHKKNYFGYDCREGYCGKVCDANTCWKPNYIAVSSKTRIQTDVVFDGCYEGECHDDQYNGYDCYHGYCKKICDFERCWEPEYEEILNKMNDKLDIIFDGCYERNCHKNQYFGYDCSRGYCRKICDINKCWEPITNIHESDRSSDTEIIFSGCHENECRIKQYYGYNCRAGFCKKVCDYNRCWEPHYTSSHESLNSIFFDGCLDESCSSGYHRGYKCTNGRCLHLCDFDKCWDVDTMKISEKKKISSRITFANCHDLTCYNGKYRGYDCRNGHCGFVCDEEMCHKQ